MAHYSIKELEHLSGIKAHTLRIWEQRYQLLQPKRTDTNIRYYDDADLKNLLNVALLYHEGYKISRIAQMAPPQIAHEVLAISESELGQAQYINQLIVAMVELDEVLFERVLSRAILQLGFKLSVRQVIYPFLNKIGLLWQTTNITPAHEHFMSHLIRQKMLVALDALPIHKAAHAPRIILALPEGELHELGLLYSHYFLRDGGFATLYLGQHLPLADLKNAAGQFKADVIVTTFTSVALKMPLPEYLAELAANVTASQILVSGPLISNYLPESFPEKIVLLKTVDDLEAWIQSKTASVA